MESFSPDTLAQRSLTRSFAVATRPAKRAETTVPSGNGCPEETAGYLAGCCGAGAACGGGAAAGAGAGAGAAGGAVTTTGAGAGAGCEAEPAATPTAKAAPRPRNACASGTRFSDRYGAIEISKKIATAPAILHVCFMVFLLLVSAV